MRLPSPFHLAQHKTNIKTEVGAGVLTFVTMAYILIVNPQILGDAGMDTGAVFTATALAAIFGTLLVAVLANLPFALAPGMGLNAFFAYTVVIKMGYSWQFALTGVFIEGLIFILLTLFNVREAILNSIPLIIKKSIGIGIGLFIAIIGLTNANVIVNGETIVMLGNMKDPSVLLTLGGILFVGILLARKVKAALLIGIAVITLAGILFGIVQLPNSLSIFSMPPSIEPIFWQFDFSQVFTTDMLIVVFTFLFVDIFDTVGTILGVCSQSKMMDKEGNIPKIKQIFLSDALATTLGAILGTSTVTVYMESSAGTTAGGRTGLTAVVVACLFALALFFFPIFSLVPTAATSAILVIVGLFMIANIAEIDFTDYKNAIPAFFTIIFMPFAYSIADGIMAGVLSYAIIHALSGNFKKVAIGTYIIAALFILKIIFL